MNWDTVKAELAKKLDPAYVKPPPQGKYGDYIEGVHAIREANRIFGYDGWSYNVDELRLTNASVDGDKHRVGYFAKLTVTVGGVSRCGIGHGQGFGRSEGDAHDSAVKEAETDALKRALRTFGNPFGLALYDKTKSEVGIDFDFEAAAHRIEKLIEEARTADRLAEIAKVENKTLQEINAACPERRDAVMSKYHAKKTELTKEAA